MAKCKNASATLLKYMAIYDEFVAGEIKNAAGIEKGIKKSGIISQKQFVSLKRGWRKRGDSIGSAYINLQQKCN